MVRDEVGRPVELLEVDRERRVDVGMDAGTTGGEPALRVALLSGPSSNATSASGLMLAAMLPPARTLCGLKSLGPSGPVVRTHTVRDTPNGVPSKLGSPFVIPVRSTPSASCPPSTRGATRLTEKDALNIGGTSNSDAPHGIRFGASRIVAGKPSTVVWSKLAGIARSAWVNAASTGMEVSAPP